MKLSKLSLKWKLFFYILLFSAVIILVFCIFQILLLDKVYKSTKINQTIDLMDDVSLILKDAKINDLSNSSSNVGIKIKEKTADAEADVYIFRREEIIQENMIPNVSYYSVYPATNKEEEFIDNVMTLEQLSFVYKTIENVDITRSIVFDENNRHEFGQIISDDLKDINEQAIIYCQRLNIQGQTNFMLIIHARVTPVQPAIDTLKTQFLYITLIVIGLSILMALILTKIIAKPIIDINTAAKSLAYGEYDTKFSGGEYLEIAELNNTLNYAAGELKKTETLQRELLANVSHDLRTPLTLISGYAEMMRDFTGEDNTGNIQIIIDESNRLKSLVTDLLELSRLSSRTEPLNISSFNLTKMIDEIVRRQQKFTEQQNFDIKFIYQKDIIVEADQRKLEQVMYNFISNAINYSGDSRVIEVIQEINDNMCVVKVKDYGIGIKQEELEYVWQRYYRVDKGHQRASQGSGLGLSIIQGILEYHGFKYGVISEEHKGSTFWFEIPIKEEIK